MSANRHERFDEANHFDDARDQRCQHHGRRFRCEEAQVVRRRHAERRHGNVCDIELPGVQVPVVRKHAALHVRPAVAPRVGRQHRKVVGKKRGGHRSVVPAWIRLVRAGIPVRQGVEERVDTEVVRHVFRRQHQAECRSACAVPPLRDPQVRDSDTLRALVAVHRQHKKQQEERVLLADAIDGDRVDVEGPDQRHGDGSRAAEEEVGNAVQRQSRGGSGNRIRQPDRGLDRHRVIRRCDTVPCLSEVDTSPHRQLHQHRVLGIRTKMPAAVLLDGVDFIELVLAQTVGGQRSDPDHHREDRCDCKHDDPGTCPR